MGSRLSACSPGDNKIPWNETFGGRALGNSKLIRLARYALYSVLASALFFSIVIALDGERNVYPSAGLVLRIATVVLGLILFLAIGCRMAAKISLQREQRFRGDSGVIFVSPMESFWTKWFDTIRYYRRPTVALFLLLLITCTYANVIPLAWFVLPLIFFAQIWMIGNIGLFLSLRAKSSGLAIYLLFFVQMAIVVVTSILSYSGFASGVDRYFEERYLTRLNRFEFFENHGLTDIDDWANPPQSWWHLLRKSDHYRHVRRLSVECTNYNVAIFLHCLVGTHFLLLSTRLVKRPKMNK